jgi:hypothetical protein
MMEVSIKGLLALGQGERENAQGGEKKGIAYRDLICPSSRAIITAENSNGLNAGDERRHFL